MNAKGTTLYLLMYSKAYRILSLKHHDSTTQKYTELGTVIVQAIRADFKHNSSECDKNMKFCLVVVYVIENIFSYGPNLKIEKWRTLDFYKIFQKSLQL